MKNKTLWKSFKADFETNHGSFPAKIGEWAKVDGKIKCCDNGFHASKRAIDAMQFVNCEIIALVEVRGESDHEQDKSAYAEMRIKKAYKWTKKDSVELAIFAAEQVIEIYEIKYPNDDRPRKAIEAAKEWLKNPTAAYAAYAAAYAAYAAARAAEATADAAHAAYAAARAAEATADAAHAAEAAAHAAEAAAYAASAAAYAAYAAARAAEATADAAHAAEAAAHAAEATADAAHAAEAAAYAASAAAYAANADKILDKCEDFIQDKIKTLEVVK